jgi:PLP dependent protein
MPSVIADRLSRLRERIDRAAAASGRDSSCVSVVAVTKTQPPQLIEHAVAAGLREIGENYVQEALAKQAQLAAVRWHLIGHVQSNKVSAIAGRFDLVHTIDSVKLGERLARASVAIGRTQDILVQVKLGDEPAKSGVDPAEMETLCDRLGALAGLRLRGLMVIAPLTDASGAPVGDPRRFFAQARALSARLAPEHRQVLSMGMSADFEAAVEEGSTMIRIGSALFGGRPAMQ